MLASETVPASKACLQHGGAGHVSAAKAACGQQYEWFCLEVVFGFYRLALPTLQSRDCVSGIIVIVNDILPICLVEMCILLQAVLRCTRA